MKTNKIYRILFFSILLHLSISSGFSQEKANLITTYNTTIYTVHFLEARKNIVDFVKQSSSFLLKQDESEREITISFYVNEKTFLQLDSLAGKLGFVSSKEVNTTSNETYTEDYNTKKQYMQSRKQAYQNELEKMTLKDSNYYPYFEEIRKIDKELLDLELDLPKKEYSNYKAQFTIYDETKDFARDGVSWVNMPGVSYQRLFIETPKPGISTSLYQGYSLKYLVTRGKSYLNLGALKDMDDINASGIDSTTFTEFFMFGFGQDWYSKHFGRGKRKFFNLYTGYDIGGLFATSSTTKKTILYCDVFLGVELIKTKYFLIDTKAGYFVPFHQNRNLRGITVNASFNFVF